MVAWQLVLRERSLGQNSSRWLIKVSCKLPQDDGKATTARGRGETRHAASASSHRRGALLPHTKERETPVQMVHYVLCT